MHFALYLTFLLVAVTLIAFAAHPSTEPSLDRTTETGMGSGFRRTPNDLREYSYMRSER